MDGCDFCDDALFIVTEALACFRNDTGRRESQEASRGSRFWRAARRDWSCPSISLCCSESEDDDNGRAEPAAIIISSVTL